MTLIDTSVWSLALRRRSPDVAIANELALLVTEGSAAMLGAVRQEVLSGVRTQQRFEALRDALRAFPDVPISIADYEDAAECFTACRARGIQGSNTDFLICAVARRRTWPVFTTDRDFDRYASVLDIEIHRPPRA